MSRLHRRSHAVAPICDDAEHMRRFVSACAIALVAAAPVGCGSNASSSPGGSSAGGAAGSAGAVSGGAGGSAGSAQDGGGGSGGTQSAFSQFAQLSDDATGLAFGKDRNGNQVLFVSLGASNEVVKVTAQGAVGKVADVPAAAGLALEPDGTLLVCGHSPIKADGVLWKLAPDGTTTPFVTSASFKTLIAVAVAPDNRVVFSDADRVYGVDSTGTVGNLVILTSQVIDPTALAFSKDGTELYVGSANSGNVWSVPRSPNVGNYGTTLTQLESGLAGLSALVVLESSDLVALSSGGVYRMQRDGSGLGNIASSSSLGSPDGAARSVGSFGDYLYLGNGKSIVRLPFSDAALPLPVR